jgi:hypothetical protein
MIQSSHAQVSRNSMMDRGYDNTLTISSSMTNVAQNDILRLSAPDSSHLRAPGMDAFDHDLNFEGENLLYLFSAPSLLSLDCLRTVE